MNSGCHSTANTYQRRQGCSNTEKERTTPLAREPSPRTVRLLQATMKYCCLERMWRDFAAHMSFRVCDNLRISCAKGHTKMRLRHLCRLPACGHRTRREGHHGTSTSDTVVCSRYSTVYYQTSPSKTDGVSESVQCVHERALGDSQSLTCPPVLAQRCALHELASNLERRTGVRNQRYPEAPRQREEDE